MVNLNTLPPLGDPFIENKAVAEVTPQEQPATPRPEDAKAVVSPAEQEETPVASRKLVGNLTPQEQTT
jgi:hypothetical protein